MANKNILLIEPGYKNKYPPLGLMKLAQYHGPHGKRDKVRFIKGEDPSVFGTAWDRIYITTLFSFEFARIAQSIDFALKVANGHADKIFVGGIAASLMPEQFAHAHILAGNSVHTGPADGLAVEGAAARRIFRRALFRRPSRSGHRGPNSGLQHPGSDRIQISRAGRVFRLRLPWLHPKMHVSAACPKLEGDQRDAESITAVVRNIEARYGPKKDLILMDNNVVASPRFQEIIAEIRDLGFVPDAKLSVGRVPVQRRVDFNQGVDARILCKDPVYLRELVDHLPEAAAHRVRPSWP